MVRALTLIGVTCLALITLVNPGATRMFAWPWTLAYAIALLAPVIAAIVRAFDGRQPLALPSRAWWVLGGASALVTIVSALASPYRAPSLLWSAPLLAGVALFFVVFDWLHAVPLGHSTNHDLLKKTLLAGFAIIACVSEGQWLMKLARTGLTDALAGRNSYPLGHSNYTAGLALLMLPLAANETVRRRGGWRIAVGATAALALAMLFTSGSRGGLIGLAVLAAGGLWAAPLPAKRKWQLMLAGALAGIAFIAANPRTRASFRREEKHLVAASDVQRSAMAVAGARMGAARPLSGWGPGTTPLAYPRFRAGLDGGVENVLQLHSTPVQTWAELGLGGVMCLLGFSALVLRDRNRDPVAALSLAGYAAFALTDWQLDVPIFAAVVAILAATIAMPALSRSSTRTSRLAGFVATACLALVALLGRRDPTPELNVRALDLAKDPVNAERAIALFRESIALNPDQEIAHFNLGWLLVVRDPAAAERHFRAAAQLVPDKGGVYFGLGLARLNQGKRDPAARALALECLNDPAFLSSPWWREAAIAPLRDATAAVYTEYVQLAKSRSPLVTLPVEQLGRVPDGPERSYRRTRTGYPVLMRNLDLPPPIDLFDVREPIAPANAAASPPPKGWLPSPFLLSLLDAPIANPQSAIRNSP